MIFHDVMEKNLVENDVVSKSFGEGCGRHPIGWHYWCQEPSSTRVGIVSFPVIATVAPSHWLQRARSWFLGVGR
ncbi:hypothetical protein Q31a_13690 [Aureliella helgolandensis]|uniref:Uncharacterized protein n=1 Tax=Aureliella helgolandensis TaxID=2527968 RepID=A0A518G3B7_9BACT|nr:hypothetical protein Q31a_13690 [Aureliella helgolandensis]